MRKLIAKSLVVFITLVPVAGFLMGMKSVDPDDGDRWLNDFSDNNDEARALAVNEGELEFLTQPPAKAPHLLQNHFIISDQSLKDGWVQMVQCHEHLDPVAMAQILYHKRRTRDLKVLSNPGIERAWVEGSSVQLENIGRDARLCVQADVHALYPNYDGSFSMQNGPFLRKFLDGYYPMHLTMDVKLPGDRLRFEAIQPQAQAGFQVSHSRDRMQVDALFVGELNIEVFFDEREAID